MQNDLPELKHCPFCGQDGLLQIGKGISYVKCSHCESEGPAYSKEHHDLAVKNWNTREAADRKDVMFLIALGFKHKIENGFHVVEGHGFKYSHIQLLNIAHRIKQEFFTRAPSDAARGEALRVFDDSFIETLDGLGYDEYGFTKDEIKTIRAALHAPVPIKQDYEDQRIGEGATVEVDPLWTFNKLIEKTGIDQNFWRDEIDKIRAALSSDREAELLAVIDELADSVRLIMPLAKGYRPDGQTDTARQTCNRCIAGAARSLEKHAAIISAAQERGKE